MAGRAYHDPATVLLDADQQIFGDSAPGRSAHEVVEAMYPYIEARLAEGLRLHSITRHMLGIFTGRPARGNGDVSCQKARRNRGQGLRWSPKRCHLCLNTSLPTEAVYA